MLHGFDLIVKSGERQGTDFSCNVNFATAPYGVWAVDEKGNLAINGNDSAPLTAATLESLQVAHGSAKLISGQ